MSLSSPHYWLHTALNQALSSGLSLPLNFSLDQMGTSKVGLVIISIVYAFARVEELSQVHELEFNLDKSKSTTSDALQREIGTWSMRLNKRSSKVKRKLFKLKFLVMQLSGPHC